MGIVPESLVTRLSEAGKELGEQYIAQREGPAWTLTKKEIGDFTLSSEIPFSVPIPLYNPDEFMSAAIWHLQFAAQETLKKAAREAGCSIMVKGSQIKFILGGNSGKIRSLTSEGYRFHGDGFPPRLLSEGELLEQLPFLQSSAPFQMELISPTSPLGEGPLPSPKTSLIQCFIRWIKEVIG